MPSPFPSMDPYLEDPAICPDFHNALAGDLRAALNTLLPRRYYARLESRPEVGIVDDDRGRPIVPDVSVIRYRRDVPSRAGQRGSLAVAEPGPRTERSQSVWIDTPEELFRHYYVEIRDASRSHELVTLIEIVSPSNKRAGDDRKAYVRKQQEVLDSDANLIEIDLLTSGEPVAASSYAVSALESSGRRGRYLVAVSRAWKRTPNPKYEVYPFGLFDSLPCIGVPLREDEDEVLLDLQYVVHRTYDTGPYERGAVDYTEPPSVPLTDDERIWVRERVVAAFPGVAESAS
jgi:hypothetical protein